MSSATDRLKKAVDELNDCPCEYHAKEAELAWDGLEIASATTIFLEVAKAWWEDVASLVRMINKALEAGEISKRKAPLRKGWKG